MKPLTFAALVDAGALMLCAEPALACSRILWNDSDLGVFVSRTMDWPESTQPKFTVLPRGQPREGRLQGEICIIEDNPARAPAMR